MGPHVLVCTLYTSHAVHVNLAGLQPEVTYDENNVWCQVKCLVRRWCINYVTCLTYIHIRRTCLSALSSSHTPLMFHGVKKMEKHLQPNHFRGFQRFLFMCAESVREEVSSPATQGWQHALGNPTLLEVILRQRE